MLALFHKCWGKSVIEIIETRTHIGQGSESGSREKAFQHSSDLCILGVSCYIPAAHRHQWQLETDDEVALFPGMPFACSLSIIMFNLYCFPQCDRFSSHIPLHCGSRREQSILFTVLPWSRWCWFRTDSRKLDPKQWSANSKDWIDRVNWNRPWGLGASIVKHGEEVGMTGTA